LTSVREEGRGRKRKWEEGEGEENLCAFPNHEEGGSKEEGGRREEEGGKRKVEGGRRGGRAEGRVVSF
jgi:hypothetical protein